jgi:hypothetical protein
MQENTEKTKNYGHISFILKIVKLRHIRSLYIQTTQWPKEKVQKDKQRFTNHTHKTKDQVTQTPLKTGVEHLPAALVAPLDNEYRLHSIFTNFYSFFCKLWNSFCKCVIILCHQKTTIYKSQRR